jgi:hypothetical protein
MGEVFTRRLRALDDKAKTLLGVALKKNSEPALVRSTFDLPAVQRAAIQNALNETFSAEIPIRFETAPDLVSGIELTTNGQKVGWSIAGYLATLEQSVGDLLKEKDNPRPKPEVNPNSETGMGGTGNLPVPLGHRPDGTERRLALEPAEKDKPEPKSEVNPNTETGMGGTGNLPVPLGHRPDGTERRLALEPASENVQTRSPVPTGGSPVGTGGSPVLPFGKTVAASEVGFKAEPKPEAPPPEDKPTIKVEPKPAMKSP